MLLEVFNSWEDNSNVATINLPVSKVILGLTCWFSGNTEDCCVRKVGIQFLSNKDMKPEDLSKCEQQKIQRLSEKDIK